MRATFLAAVVLTVSLLGGCASRPVAAPDSAVAMRDNPLDINVLANDHDPDGRPLILVKATGARKGATSINPDNTIRYTPNPGAEGDDKFEYLVKNNRGGRAWATVNVRIVEPLPGRILGSPEPRKAPAIQLVETDPASKPAPMPAPVPPPPPTAASEHPPASAIAFIQGVSVTLFTREDVKDKDEPVTLTVRRGTETLAERAIGGGQVWPPQTERTEELTLSRAIPATDTPSLSLEVRKTPAGPGVGGSWIVQIDVQGRLSDGRTVSLVGKTLPFRFGGGSSSFRTWRFDGAQP